MPQYQGVWTLEQQAQAQSNQQWVTDPNFKNTTLLLQADGTGSGSQNNTFLDGSTNNFFITRNGNTTQGSFSPFSQASGYWGNYFNGSTDKLTMASNAGFAFGTGAYTVEFWVYFISIAGTDSRIFDAGSASGSFGVSIDNTNAVNIAKYGTGYVVQTPARALPSNQWAHVAVVRDSTSTNATRIYINGSLAVTGTDNNNWTVTTTPSICGLDLSLYNPQCYLSNLRVVKGGSLYTSNFTPTTAPLSTTVSSGTVYLLTCQSNRFVDNSGTISSFTITGTPSIQAFGPFAPALQWTPDVVGGSGYFDGSGDYLTCSVSASPTGTQNFTIEGWIYVPTTNTEYAILDNNNSSGGFYLRVNTSGQINVVQTNTVGILTSTTSIKANSWNYFCVTRSGNTFNIYLNSTSVDSTTSSSVSFSTGTSTVIGAYYNGALNFTGYMSSLRVVIGTATAPTSVPTAPLTAVANTQLLLNYTNAGIYDGKMANNLETVGNAQVSTSVVKYGSGSIFAGPAAADYVLFPYSPNLNFGAGDFTIECWLFWTGGTSENTLIMNNASGGVNLALTNSGTWQIGTSYVAWQNDFGTTPTKNTWNHLAVSRNGTVIKAFINGVQIYVGTNSTNYTNTSTWYIAGNGAAAIGLIGYVDDFRISRFARYFTTFTPPQQALPRQ